MSCKIVLVICAAICVMGSLDAATIRIVQNTDSVVHKLDYDQVQQNVRGSRQTPVDGAEDSDEDDDEEDAELLQQNIIRQQQAEEQAIADSQEGSDEDDEADDDEEEDDDDDDDDDSFFGRRLKRDVVESETINEIVENSKPFIEEEKETSEGSAPSTDANTASPSAPASPNTSVLILIRDAIKKVTTELPNTKQVAASAQQYFQMFEHFLQQAIQQVIGDDDDDIEVEQTTVSPLLVAAETSDKETENISELASPSPSPSPSPSLSPLPPADKENAVVVPEQKPETIETSTVVETKV